MSDASPEKPVEIVKEEPPPELTPAPNPDVSIPEEVKQEIPQQQEPRPGRERAGDGDPHPHPSGELSRTGELGTGRRLKGESRGGGQATDCGLIAAGSL